MNTPKSKLNTQIYEEACEWLVHFRAGDADDDIDARRQLDEWLRRSPEHVRAYLEVSTLWEDVASHDAERKIDADAHISRARAETNVVPLDLGPESGAWHLIRGPNQVPGTGFKPRFAALAASILVVLAATSTWWLTQRNTYVTAIGEQRSITLDDGSSIDLNARSRVRVRYTDQQRLVDLLEGQALFRVTKDKNRPFVVATDDTRVRAVGTQFDVNRRKAITTVTVIEGKVGVNSAQSSSVKAPKAAEVFLTAGEQLTVTPKAVALPKRANIAAATAWTQHRLVFDSVPLVDVAEEFNRYNKRPIVIQDKGLESFGVIGVFSSTDPASLLTFLRAQPEMDVTENDREIVITGK